MNFLQEAFATVFCVRGEASLPGGKQALLQLAGAGGDDVDDKLRLALSHVKEDCVRFTCALKNLHDLVASRQAGRLHTVTKHYHALAQEVMQVVMGLQHQLTNDIDGTLSRLCDKQADSGKVAEEFVASDMRPVSSVKGKSRTRAANAKVTFPTSPVFCSVRTWSEDDLGGAASEGKLRSPADDEPASFEAQSILRLTGGDDERSPAGFRSQKMRHRMPRRKLDTTFSMRLRSGLSTQADEEQEPRVRSSTRSTIMQPFQSMPLVQSAPSATPRTSWCHVRPCLEHLDSARVADAVKDTDFVVKAIRSLELDLFRDFREEDWSAFLQALDVYEFEDGWDAAVEGTESMHFYIVAEGTFVILQDRTPIRTLGKGKVFGEDTLLVSSERNRFTVRAKGVARAYGVRGIELRRVLQQQYVVARTDVIAAVNELLERGVCGLLRGLSAFQKQCVYDSAKVRSFAAGDQLPGDCVHVLWRGSLTVSSASGDMKRIGMHCTVGDAGLLGEADTERVVLADGDAGAVTATFSRPLLEEMFGKTEARGALLSARLAEVLVQVQSFGRLPAGAVEAATKTAEIVEVRQGDVIELSQVSLAVCLSGDVEASSEGPERTAPRTTRIGYDSDEACIGAELLQSKVPWPLRLQGAAASSATGYSALVAVWAGDALERAMRQGWGEYMPPSLVRGDTRSLEAGLMQSDRVVALRNVLVLRTLSTEQVERLAASILEQTLVAGEVLFRQGEVGCEFFIIRSGCFEVSIDNRRIRTVGLGDYFGERALLLQEPRSATVTALEDSSVWRMHAAALKGVLSGPILEYMRSRIALQSADFELQALEVMRTVGAGAFGVVKMVRHPDTGIRYALKCVRKRRAAKLRQQQALRDEKAILAELDHPFIIKFIKTFSDQSSVYFLTELVTGGELLDALDAIGRTLFRREAAFYVGSISLALDYLHSRQIAYLDIKCENCLIDEHGYLKLIDFGVAERVLSGRLHVVKGTPLFMAPEVIRPTHGYTTTADLWSLGVCAFDFMCGQLPFAEDTWAQEEILKAILKTPLRFPADLALEPVSKDFLSGLLTRDPNLRLGGGCDGIRAIKTHAFFDITGFSWDGLLGRQISPPFLPTGEVYSADCPDFAGRRSMFESDGDDDDESDPDIAWHAEF